MPMNTIGYEGATPAEFDGILLHHGVEILIDVRAVAVSRRAGFSKTVLKNRLSEVGIEYLHLRDLGDPKPGREAARAGNFPLFRLIFAEHLRTPDAKAALTQLAEITKTQTVALMCYEADAVGCHRSIIAAEIAKRENLPIVHLKVQQGGSLSHGQSRAGHYSGQGLATA